ncbi:MAG: SoxR reducing system RseC family protein [Gammaproteobacteria bacterium]|nr:SoxR reducing system RseC family protein [Gammaproteobacteria bacterium]NNJ98148.1 SoxR reducing system RseC family protein [Gammaproteobacteria bacterium]
MIEETARVIAVEQDQLLLEAQTHAACHACAARPGCGTSLLSKWVGRRFTRFRVHNSVNASVGDDVVVGLAEAAMLKGSVLVYLLPLLAMIIFAVLADSLIPAESGYRDLIVLLVAVVGFGLMLVLSNRLLASRSNRSRLTPVLLRKNIAGS